MKYLSLSLLPIFVTACLFSACNGIVNTNYGVRVKDRNKDRMVAGARVTLQLSGMVIQSLTDSNGFAAFAQKPEDIGKTGKLRVECPGFHPYDLQVTVKNDFVEEIPLTPEDLPYQPTPLPSSSLVPPPTPTPKPIPEITLNSSQTAYAARGTTRDYKFNGMTNTPVTFTLQAHPRFYGYNIEIFSALGERLYSNSGYSGKEKYSFTPQSDGIYIVRITGTSDPGDFTLIMTER